MKSFSIFRAPFFLTGVVVLICIFWWYQQSGYRTSEKIVRAPVERGERPASPAMAIDIQQVADSTAKANDVNSSQSVPAPSAGLSGGNAELQKNGRVGVSLPRPLDQLEITETLAEEWRDGTPKSSGWYSRIRIVKSSFKSGLVRIEEKVEVKVDGGGLQVIRSVTDKAMDARHLLVSARHVEKLTEHGISLVKGKNPNYVRVTVENPNLISALPLLFKQLEDLHLDGVEVDSLIEASGLPNDPLIGSGAAWHLDNLGLLPGHRKGVDLSASSAWDVRTDASSVLVAVIDSGISTQFIDLIESSYLMPGETLGDSIDNDGNGYVDDIYGYDFVDDDSNPSDENGHGSACAALIGATGNNSLGSSGVAWKASILSCRFLDRYGLGTLSDAIDAIDYARNAKAKILNLSWSYSGEAPLLTEALSRCDQSGILMVCASGNFGSAAPVPVPAAIDLPHLVTVAASTPQDTLASFSVVDPQKVHLAAPGVDLPIALSTSAVSSTDTVNFLSGTSFSAALVSGGLALGLAEFPLLTPKAVLQRMLESVDPIPGGASALKTGGRLNLEKFLKSNTARTPHDLFADRRLLGDGTGQWSGRNEGAGIEAIDASLNLSPPPVRSLWFEWTASSDGLLRINASSDGQVPVSLAIFKAVENLPGKLLTRATLGETLELAVLKGQKFFWMVDSATPIATGIHLTWQLPPTNDNWLNATLINNLPVSVPGNSLGATVENFELDAPHFRYLPEGSVWWKWTSSVTEIVRASVSADHAIFMLPLNSRGSPKFENGYQYFNFQNAYYPVVAGKSYAIIAIPLSRSAAGPFNLSITAIQGFTIIGQPAAISTLPGEVAVLAVQVAGFETPLYQWYKNDEPIPFAQDSTLRLSPVTEESFANYHVVVSNGSTTIQSDTATVSKRDDKPRLVAQSARKSLVLGQAFNLSATFRSATTMSYTWKKNGQVISNAITPDYAKTSSVAEDAGTYQLTATNSIGSTTATFQVSIVETPWKGWVDRTPGNAGTTKILQVSLEGGKADAFTAIEWLHSDDAGENWLSTPMPPTFAASAGAVSPNGTAVVSGYSINTSSSRSQAWRFATGAGWVQIYPQLILDASATPIDFNLGALQYFDGKWWTITSYSGSALMAIYSTDGVRWFPVKDVTSSSGLLRVGEMFRYEDRLAFTTWNSSNSKVLILFSAGGSSRLLNFPNEAYDVMKIGDVYYNSKRQKIKETDMVSSNVPSPWMPYFSGSIEGSRDGEFFIGLGDGALISGIYEKTITSRRIGFSSFAKMGSRWLVGYPDGRLWAGTNLKEIPTAPPVKPNFNTRVKAYRGEFRFGNYHSSDGARWQLLGAANTGNVYPLGQGESFLYSIDSSSISKTPKLSMVDSIYPNATEWTAEANVGSSRWSGSTGILAAINNTDEKYIRYISKKNQVVVAENVNIGVNWGEIRSAVELNGRWFVDGGIYNSYANFQVTSPNGRDWQPFTLPPCRVGQMNGKFIAIENSSRGYTSTNGTGWIPFIPQGLPEGLPLAILPYRGFYVAQYNTVLYTSPDGIKWFLGSPPTAVDYLVANDHTLLAANSSGQFFQPGGETATGPWIELPEVQTSVSVPLHQGFRYDLIVGDADGDLSRVDCLIDGQVKESRTVPPFAFDVDSPIAGYHAVEFVARDASGRISRVTSKFEVIASGVTSSNAVIISADLSKAIKFKGGYYLTYRGAVCRWLSGDLWQPISPAYFSVTALIANSQAIIASGPSGLLVNNDTAKWTNLGGFGAVTPSLRSDTFEMFTYEYKWNSSDGFTWTPSTGSFHGALTDAWSFAWASDDFGIRQIYGNIQLTYNGGLDWLTISSSYAYSQGVCIPIKNGFLFHNPEGIYRILRDEITFTTLYREAVNLKTLYATQLGGLSYVGKVQTFLRSTIDGINFTDHTPPPNLKFFSLARHNNQWIAYSADRICASPDLRSWRTLVEFSINFPDQRYIDESTLTMKTEGDDSLSFTHSANFYPFILNPDFTIRRGETAPNIISEVPNWVQGGMLFKNRHIASAFNLFTKPADSESWKLAPIFPSPGFVQLLPVAWPVFGAYRDSSSGLHAATRDRFVVLHQDAFNVPMNYVYTSDDGENFQIHNWAGPIPLPEITNLASSPTGFLAAATQGRVLVSNDGLTWTVNQIDPNLSVEGIIYFNGKWHVTGSRSVNYQGEVWSSTDGRTWSRTTIFPPANSYYNLSSRSFLANGLAWMFGSRSGWIKSSDGVNWQTDPLLSASMNPMGAYAGGIIGERGGSIAIFNPATGKIVSTFLSGAQELRWLDEIPFYSSAGRFTEWVQEDPRIVKISAKSGTFGVGDYIEISITAAEFAVNPTLQLSLSTDRMLTNNDDIILGSYPWQSGISQAMSDTRTFRVALPPSITPGQFRVAAKFSSSGRDISLHNNQMVSDISPIEIPGYNLRLATAGSGTVETSDPRVVYPQGARVQLQAIPESGFTFQAWDGSFVSSQASISILMNQNQNLAVTFIPGIRVIIRTIGQGSVRGGQSMSVLQSGEVVQLLQTPASGWVADGWSVNGVRRHGSSLQYQPTGDSLIESHFIPDFSSRRDTAFLAAPSGTDRSWSADPDSDGLTNWQEVLLSLNPLIYSPLDNQIEHKPDHLRLVFTRPQASTGNSWITSEFSEDFKEWKPADSIHLTERILNVKEGMETVEIILPCRPFESGFFRLKMPTEP